jgi:hypothetical protein
MKNIHLLPTDKPTRLWYNNLRRRLELDEYPSRHPSNIAKNIYITSSEEIKEGDWFYVKTSNIYGGNVVVKSLGFGENCWSDNILTETTDEKGYHKSHCKKIILTTDQDLIKELEQIDQNNPITKGSTALIYKQNVQSIPDEFLKWFVKNPSCESVDVKLHQESLGEVFNGKNTNTMWTDPKYKIIIPKEEQKQHIIDIMKADEELGLYKETLEEAAKQYAIKEDAGEGDDRKISEINSDFLEGAKWQQEKMYTEEEVKQIIDKTLIEYTDLDLSDVPHWFIQFKKK